MLPTMQDAPTTLFHGSGGLGLYGVSSLHISVFQVDIKYKYCPYLNMEPDFYRFAVVPTQPLQLQLICLSSAMPFFFSLFQIKGQIPIMQDYCRVLLGLLAASLIFYSPVSLVLSHLCS